MATGPSLDALSRTCSASSGAGLTGPWRGRAEALSPLWPREPLLCHRGSRAPGVRGTPQQAGVPSYPSPALSGLWHCSQSCVLAPGLGAEPSTWQSPGASPQPEGLCPAHAVSAGRGGHTGTGTQVGDGGRGSGQLRVSSGSWGDGGLDAEWVGRWAGPRGHAHIQVTRGTSHGTHVGADRWAGRGWAEEMT